MNNKDNLIAQARAGQRISEFLDDPEVQAIYHDAVGGLETRILGFDPAEQTSTMIAKAMLLGIKEYWAKLEGVIARGQQAEAALDGSKPQEQPGRVL